MMIFLLVFSMQLSSTLALLKPLNLGSLFNQNQGLKLSKVSNVSKVSKVSKVPNSTQSPKAAQVLQILKGVSVPTPQL